MDAELTLRAGSRSLKPSHVLSASVSLTFLRLGLFTVGWDRLSIPVGTFHLKIPVIAFAAALAFSLIGDRSGIKARDEALRAAIGLLLFVYFLVSALGIGLGTSLGQMVTVILGAIVPYAATSRVVRAHDAVLPALNAFINGALFGCVFGLYQLASSYLGVSYLLTYTGLGSGLHRIASLSYEPAYFGTWLILGLAAIGARSVYLGVPPRIRTLALLVVVLLLANARSVLFMLPLLLIFAAAPDTGFTRRLGGILASTVVLGFVGLLALAPSTLGNVAAQIASIFNPNQASSNGPRLDSYRLAERIGSGHLLHGVGPGNLLQIEPLYGVFAPVGSTPNGTIVNDIWLQALVDGGVLLLLAQAVVCVVAVVLLFRSSVPASRLLMAGWLSVTLVEGVLTSDFYDVKLWCVLALAVAVVSRHQSTDGARQAPVLIARL